MIVDILTVLTQLNKIIIELTVSEFEAIVIFLPVGGFDYVGEETEVVAQSEKRILVDPGPALGKQVRKDASVFS